jgi:hypothetical protein
VPDDVKGSPSMSAVLFENLLQMNLKKFPKVPPAKTMFITFDGSIRSAATI